MKSFKSIILSLALLSPLLLFSQQNDKQLITEQIKYSVNIKKKNIECSDKSPIDIEKTEEWWDENIEDSKQRKLLTLLLNKLRSGELKAYKPKTNNKPSLCNDTSCVMSLQEIENVLYDSIQVFVETEFSDSLTPAIVSVPIDLDDMIGLGFVEEWYFDVKKNQFIKKVNAISILEKRLDEYGDLCGYKTLFYIWLNNVEILK